MTNLSVTPSQRLAARIAGLAYVIAILYVPVYLLTSASLSVSGDPAATLANVQANPVLFRVGIATSLVMFVSVFVLIAALYVTVEPVNRTVALLGLVLRLPEAMLGLVSVVFSLLPGHVAQMSNALHALPFASLGLVLGLPGLVRHPVDDLASLLVGQVQAALLGGGTVPFRQAVAAEAGEIHQIDVLHVGALAKMLHQAAKGGRLKLDAGLVVHGTSPRAAIG